MSYSNEFEGGYDAFMSKLQDEAEQIADDAKAEADADWNARASEDMADAIRWDAALAKAIERGDVVYVPSPVVLGE